MCIPRNHFFPIRGLEKTKMIISVCGNSNQWQPASVGRGASNRGGGEVLQSGGGCGLQITTLEVNIPLLRVKVKNGTSFGALFSWLLALHCRQLSSAAWNCDWEGVKVTRKIQNGQAKFCHKKDTYINCFTYINCINWSNR